MVNPMPEGGHRSAGAAPTAHVRDVNIDRESKAAYKTTEFYIYLAVAALTLISSFLIGTSHGHNDYFRGDKAWFYIVLLTIGYLLSRGLAKSGRRAPGDR
jgi:F0F1-type ATP synthase assembly protein I